MHLYPGSRKTTVCVFVFLLCQLHPPSNWFVNWLQKVRICIIASVWNILPNQCCVCACKWVKHPVRLCFWWSHDIKLASAGEFVDWGQDIVWEEWIARLVVHLHNEQLSIGWWVVVCWSVLSKHNWMDWEVVLRCYSLISATSVPIILMFPSNCHSQLWGGWHD